MKKSDISLVMVGRATDTQFVHDRLMLVNHTTDSSFKIKTASKNQSLDSFPSRLCLAIKSGSTGPYQLRCARSSSM